MWSLLNSDRFVWVPFLSEDSLESVLCSSSRLLCVSQRDCWGSVGAKHSHSNKAVVVVARRVEMLGGFCLELLSLPAVVRARLQAPFPLRAFVSPAVTVTWWRPVILLLATPPPPEVYLKALVGFQEG